VVFGEHGLPEVAQLSVVRIGDMLVTAVPAEPTTSAGRLFEQAAVAGVDSSGTGRLRAVVVGLANGFIQYVTTRYEYAEQAYEGGSTLYGPRSAEVLAGEIRSLGKALAAAAPNSPPIDVAPITAYPGAATSVMPRPTAMPALAYQSKISSHQCDPDTTLRIDWIDEPPGRLIPSAGQILGIDEFDGTRWKDFAWDDQKDVVVEAVAPVKGGFKWRVTLARPTAGKALRLRVLPRPGQPLTGFESSFDGCSAPRTGR
jgi:hypothetical protein